MQNDKQNQVVKFTISSPSIARLEFDPSIFQTVKDALSYSDKSAEFAYKKYKNNRWAQQSNSRYYDILDSLKDKIKQNILLEDDEGYYTYRGIYAHLAEALKPYKIELIVEDKVQYPEFGALPYDFNYKPVVLRQYQKEASDTLVSAKFGAISCATGSGKSLMLESIIRTIGLKSLIVAPTISIAEQLLEQFQKAFGKNRVGLFGNGKKHANRVITIAIAASLVRLDNEELVDLVKSNQVVCVDESHQVACDTLANLALNLCKDIPYRFFVSATQSRNDGRDVLLEAVIGPVLYTKSYQELAKQGYLAPLDITLYAFDSHSKYFNKDNPKKMAQEHFYYNREVLKHASNLINQCLSRNESTIVLVDEKLQIDKLVPFLKYSYITATSDDNVKEVVDKFNQLLYRLVIGTSAIGMGTDIKPVQNLILLTYGSSEVKTLQQVGRATRLFPNKKECKIYDYNTTAGSGPTHTRKKMELYRDIIGNANYIKVNSN